MFSYADHAYFFNSLIFYFQYIAKKKAEQYRLKNLLGRN